MPAWASLMEQVAIPATSVVVEVVHGEPLQTTEPVGVPPGPLTVAVKVKVPPVETMAELSVTAVVEVAFEGEAASLPKEPL